ncbi:(2Fe-2S)-binding protein [Bacillus sp. FJAT-18017]|uniref:FAD-dependent oxidoreductase n=1 Tax=Bacillus sp. FJAT-18017 TaxID=1705566 RepID=UPI0006AE25F3|nr:FAD-dependent oxidoreductase [Bacillus sp. FJAT-18017]ALC92403.1 (2Fe-2S)-binding protein [Bacillus sp. FJAT-18017]
MSGQSNMPKFPRTYWREIELPKFEKLSEDISVDVAIVGAGMTGITTAYLLTQQGKRVAIIEAGSVLNGTTGHTTAKVTAQHGLLYDELINHFGEEKAKLYYESHADAIGFIRRTVNEQGIDCDFSDQEAVMYATTEQYQSKLETEMEAYQKLSIPGELRSSIPFDIEIKNALVMPNQAQFHPLKYLRALLKKAVDAGCLVYENTTAKDITVEGGTVVHTKEDRKISCSHAVIASHWPFFDKRGLYFARMYASRSYAIGVKTEKEYPGGMYISADSPSRSIRYTPVNGENLLIIGGENHRTGTGKDTLEHYEALEKWTEEVFGIHEYEYRWSAQDLETLDKLPYIGPLKDDEETILVATGYKKWGMTTSTLAAHILTDYVMDIESPYKELYHPSRFELDPALKKAATFNLEVAGHFVKGKLEFVPKDPEDLKVGEGGVVLVNGKRAGGYKDETGQLYLVDTTCTHLGCECEWNHAEKTWDCPCHGSRFSYGGDVVEGPAIEALKKLED